MPWDDAFWTGQGYDVLLKHMKTGGEAAKTAAKVLHEKAQLDAEYAKGLAKLSKSVATLAKEDFGTMKAFWDNMRLEIDTQAKLHQQIATSIGSDVVKALDLFREEQLKQRTTLEKKYTAAEKNYATAKVNEQKARKAALAASKTCETVAETHSRAQGNEKEASKTEKAYQKAKKDAEAADKEFRLCIRKVREAKVSLETEFLTCTQEYQAQEQARILHIRQDLEKFADVHLTILPQLIDSHQKMRNDTAQIDGAADTEMVAQQKGTGSQRPEDVLYQNYALDPKNQMAPQRRAEAIAHAIADLEQDLASQQKGLAGIENLLKVYKDQPSFANEITRTTSEHQLNSVKEYMDRLRALISQYEQTLNGTGISKSAAMSGATLAGGHSSVASTASVGGYSASGYDDEAQAAPAATGFSAPAASTGAKCRALYDFTASNEGELTIKEGDVMNIIATDDPDWWTVELNGNQGYVPHTYVEAI